MPPVILLVLFIFKGGKNCRFLHFAADAWNEAYPNIRRNDHVKRKM